MILAQPAGPDRFRVSVAEIPLLNDHRVQGLTVLPGAAFVEMARSVAGDAPLSEVVFLQPILAGEEPKEIALERTPSPDGGQGLTFKDPASSAIAARILFAGSAAEPPTHGPALLPPEETSFSAWFERLAAMGAPAPLYWRFGENGNSYGPTFQRILDARQDGDAIVAKLGLVGEDDPILVDAAVQVLALRHLGEGKTYVWRGADRIERFAAKPAAGAWAIARGDNVSIVDDQGALRLRLTGVRLSLLERETLAENWVIAATFTAEPLEEPLRFWSSRLRFPFAPRFAPYNQIFQELLAPDSAFRRNLSGANLILVDLEDWAPPLPPSPPLRSSAPLEFAGARTTLPNGAEIAHLNAHETSYVYREIFEDRCYLRHGISLPPQATVVDIGANIGLFSLFVRSECPDATVHAYEPSPLAFAALAANCAAFGPNLHPHHAGVSDHRGRARLTFYRESSVFSSFHPDEAEDRQAIQAVVANVVRDELQGSGVAVADVVGDLTTHRLDAQTFDCPLLSVSDILRDQHLPRIDLLKIDAEKCEREILRGIADADWARIDQMVIEVHDRSRALLDEVRVLLEARGFRCAVEEETLLEGSGLFNVYARRGAAAPAAAAADEAELTAKTTELARALDAYAAAGGPPALLAICPRRHDGAPRERLRAFDRAEAALLDHLRTLPRVQGLASAAIESMYPMARYRVAPASVLGHMPFAPEGYAALGTALVRALHARRRPPLKAIAVDCDHTLWRGVCGEDGPAGVIVSPAHRALQEFLVRLAGAGVLLCLCSKNRPEDVWAVFAEHPGMVLKREQLAASRIDWRPKSAGIRSLAAELSIGAEAFVLIDDNPVECAEVTAHCPEALALQLPDDPATWADWLRHVWLFDVSTLTAEDARRTDLMRENAARESFRGQTSSLGDFIAGLRLQVELAPATPEDYARLAQLTQRTNQFNFTTRRRTEAELDRFLQAEGGQALGVRVTDRFGDYGLVGALLYRTAGPGIVVDTFLLSCRVLGRGVEHQALAGLARRARAAGAEWIELPFAASPRNEPAGVFFRELAGGAAGPMVKLATDALQHLAYRPASAPAAPAGGRIPAPPPVPALPRSPLIQVAAGLRDPAQIAAAVDAFRLGGQGGDDGLPATLAGKLLRIWRRVLGRPDIAADQNFFDAGGTSLRAVQVVAAVHRDLGLPLSVAELFERPTVQSLVERFEPAATPDAVHSALERGARRKQRLQRIRT